MIEALDRDDRFALGILLLIVPFTHLAHDRPAEALAFLEDQRQRLPLAYRTFNIWSVARTAHTLLYSGDGAAALRFMDDVLPVFQASSWARGRFYATTMRSLDARCALAAARSDRTRRTELVSRAARAAQAILDRNRPHTTALHLLLQAEISKVRGDDEQARLSLSRCADGAASHQSPMLACYAQRSLGVLLGGSQGEQLKSSAEARLLHEGVRNPSRWTRIWVDIERS